MSLVPDYVLFRTLAEYRQAHALLAGNGVPDTFAVQAQLEEALDTVSAELRHRGIGPHAAGD